MDIEDIGGSDSISDGSLDFDFIDYNQKVQDFEKAVDLFGDISNQIDPSQVDPLTYQPTLLPEFNALREAIVNHIREYPPQLQSEFLKKYLEEVSTFFNYHHLKDIKKIIDAKINENKTKKKQ